MFCGGWYKEGVCHKDFVIKICFVNSSVVKISVIKTLL